MKLTQKTKDHLLDATLYSLLFYILASPDSMKTMAAYLPETMRKNQLASHAAVFFVIYMAIQRVTLRV